MLAEVLTLYRRIIAWCWTTQTGGLGYWTTRETGFDKQTGRRFSCRHHIQDLLRGPIQPPVVWVLGMLPCRYITHLHLLPEVNKGVNNIFTLMFIGPCIIAIVEEWKTNLISLYILFHLLCAQHVSDINISVFRSLRLCWWITTSLVLFSVRCVLEFLLRLIFGGVRFAGWSTASTCKTNTTKYQPQQKLQHTTNWEQDDRCGNSSTQSQAPEDGYINVRNMLSA